MARTLSTMLPLGTKAPFFKLPDTEGRLVSLDDFANAPALLVMFICNHCPYVKHIADVLAQLTTTYKERGVAVVAINSNDASAYPDDSPPMMKKEKELRGYTFPYLFDESQDVAKAYEAACTPDFFLFDSAQRLVYRGQLDGSRPGSGVPVTGEDLNHAMNAVLAGKPVAAEQKPSMGCNIKWRQA